jgi:hypothetical protein
MREPSVRSSRRAIAGGVLTVILVGGAGFLLGRSTVPRVAPARPAAPPAPVSPPPARPRLLDRAAIVDLVRKAADALASGASAPPAQVDMVGRRFALAVPFGCSGPAGAESNAPMRWRYDESAHVLRIQIAETSWQPQDWGLPEGSDAQVRGFWIAHPWSTGESCPGAPADLSVIGSGPVVLPGQTLAVASFAPADAASSPKPLEAVVKLDERHAPPIHGLRARIRGHIDHVPGSAVPVRCVQPAGVEQQPICAVAVTFDELSVEDPETGETLATWNLG